jgi:diadenosine tetraphosphate (Ap4A) HIT family hydrolase
VKVGKNVISDSISLDRTDIDGRDTGLHGGRSIEWRGATLGPGPGDRSMKRTWPDDWEARKRGESCYFCGDLSARSFHSGRVSEAILERNAIANGHVAVVFRGRHVADFTDLSTSELTDYSQDIQDVGMMIERVFRPCHMNYLLLGNIVPHLHVHVVPRYLDDPAPERPLPWDPSPVPDAIFAKQFQQLREAGGLSE